jgi:hypothetical protein
VAVIKVRFRAFVNTVIKILERRKVFEQLKFVLATGSCG